MKTQAGQICSGYRAGGSGMLRDWVFDNLVHGMRRPLIPLQDLFPQGEKKEVAA